METVRRVACILLTLYWLVLFVRIIMSWFAPPRSGAGRGLFGIVYDLTEPVMRLVRGLLPPLRMGAMGLDLSPIILFIAIYAVQAGIGCQLFRF